MLDEVVGLLACPVCGHDLVRDERTLVCQLGHGFDIARQGYVTLAAGAGLKFEGDSTAMLDAREEFLGAGHFDPFADALAEVVAQSTAVEERAIAELGAGTGFYLARVLGPGSVAVGLDVSKPAARRIARADPRIGAVVADAWGRLPIRDGALTHVMCVFAPRNTEESRRVLRGDGTLVVLTPTDRHLAELVSVLGLVHVDDRKLARLDDAARGRFERTGHRTVEFTMSLSRGDVANVVGMGPSARHLAADEITALAAGMAERTDVTASATISVFRPAR
ncbi:methyltransferase type 11 [Rhodococcus rhodnii]|uniref:rRNA (Guanine-N(1)-)-methyltransferase n=2 Tax=Rhodococcus rhodnii TaxID=38312 RepID=R7WQ31_9NOCA|nr:methyltransferase domain-containing protein [Rhodococcus rhodnii]EOM76109.1 rRNA (guanine-N(1)-)-methyltransferase [Rhodococcus rhodnii LMG 5362]TXG91770.1 methyltransferase type 11 [Rhodococcus rhodnii]